YGLILATNPIFPAPAVEHRIHWAGLEPGDFQMYTSYESSRHCKPNPAYYQDILEQQGLKPEQCLMVGNDVEEDMVAASLGLEVFLLTPCLICRGGGDLSAYPQGDFDALLDYLQTRRNG
ncbi:MAG: HAD hydrolase-like protein, partial [Oscillospiraceae bacterium]|nr:HAD hydrolase-like protein [Oscillospiraceae bacterium]